MKVIYKGRQQGKTTEIIKECAANKKYSLIVCMSRRECERVFGMAKEMELTIPYPITYEEFLNHRYAGQNIDAFYIDNIDILLQSLSRGVPINTVSITDPGGEATV